MIQTMTKPKKIAFQGEPGANSHIAIAEAYPDAEALPCPTFEDALAAIASGEAGLGMIPIENSVAGRVAGVKGVRNHLEVALPPGDHRDDATLTATANDTLTLGHTMTVGVEATAKNGDVTLTGAVRLGAERAAAEAMIAGLTGVRTVTNDIEIRDDARPLYPEPGLSP